MRPSLSKLRRTSPSPARPFDASAQDQGSSITQTTVLQTLPTAILEEIVALLIDQGCGSIGHMAICNTSKEFKQICENQVLWERRCRQRGWEVRPSPMRTWFAHYLCESCTSYNIHMNEMLIEAGRDGDVARVAAALAWGGDPTLNEQVLRYSITSVNFTWLEYTNAKGDMLGVVKLLLQFGSPPQYAVRESLEWLLTSGIYDDDFQPQSDYQKLYIKFMAKQSYEVALLLFDYIEETHYNLRNTNTDNISTYMKILRSVLDRGESAKALRLLLQKVPGLAQRRYTDPMKDFEAYQEAPYGMVIDRSSEESSRMIEALLDFNFPTVLGEEEEPSYMRYATAAAAAMNNCRAFKILRSHGAPFPRLTRSEEQDLMQKILQHVQYDEEEGSSDDNDDDSESENDEGSATDSEECDMYIHLVMHDLLSSSPPR